MDAISALDILEAPVLYRLRPPATLDWCDLPGKVTIKAAADHDRDLDLIDWKPTEQVMFSINLLRTALRYGVATQTGIALDAVDAGDLGHADDIRATGLAAAESFGELRASQGELMERMIPGWVITQDELARRVWESGEQAAREADEHLAEALAVPAKPNLIEHWKALGGKVPD